VVDNRDLGDDDGPPRIDWHVPSAVRRALFYFVASILGIVVTIAAVIGMKLAQVDNANATTITALVLGFTGVLLAQCKAAFEAANAISDAEEAKRAALRAAARSAAELDDEIHHRGPASPFPPPRPPASDLED
jgi:phosphoglycerol transferase MdoB-like AlkP superfamily enzyme